MRVEFDQDRRKPNPYEEPQTCEYSYYFRCFSMLNLVVVTTESLKRQLDGDEKRELLQGRSPPHAISASTFICNAIQVEAEQYVPTCTTRIDT